MAKNIIGCVFIAFFSLYAHTSLAIDLGMRPDVQHYIEFVCENYDFDENLLTSWFNQIDFNQEVLEKLHPHGKPMSWYDYRQAFITPKRVKQGVHFWKKNAQALQLASQRYGVPESIIVGIIGVETSYGENKGDYPVFSTLATLAFNDPSRSKYFKSELTSFLLLSQQAGWNPLSIKGSYAAALGLPQFMPSSYRNYAIDSNSKGYADLINNDHDAIYSVAYYLNRKGWHEGDPVAMPAKVTNKNYLQLKNTPGKTFFTLKKLQSLGLKKTTPVSDSLNARVLFLEYPGMYAPWLTFHNFAVIKRYNASDKYAMAVYQLGNIVAKAANQEE